MAELEKQKTGFDTDLSRWFSEWPRFPTLRRFWDEMQNAMRIEEKVEDGQLVVRAEMPGIDPDKDVDIHVRDHMLHIEAERREEHEETKEGRYRSEFQYGHFVRNVPLPPDADESDVSARYADGILEIRMPVDRKQAEATRIEVAHE